MNGAIFPLVTKSPLMRPKRVPKTRQNASMIQAFPVALSTTTPRPEVSATMEPTDKSINPAMITMDIPSVMMPLMEA